MKKVITTLLIATALTGCASVKVYTQVGEPEKTQIKEGKLIAFNETYAAYTAGKDYRTKKIDKAKQNNGVYICATSDAPNDVCYTHLSAVIGKYFADNGIRVAKERSASDVVMYVGINIGYVYQGILGEGNNARLMDEMEESLAKNNALSVTIADPAPEYNEAAITDRDNKDFLMRLGAVVLTGMAIGANSTQMANGVGSAANLQTCGRKCSYQAMYVDITEYNPKTGVKVTMDSSFLSKNDYVPRLRIYNGPVKAGDAFPVLFDRAMKEIVADIVLN